MIAKLRNSHDNSWRHSLTMASTAPSASSQEHLHNKYQLVQNAIMQLEQDIQTTRSRHAAKQAELQALLLTLRCNNTPEHRSDASRSGASSQLLSSSFRKTVTFALPPPSSDDGCPLGSGACHNEELPQGASSAESHQHAPQESPPPIFVSRIPFRHCIRDTTHIDEKAASPSEAHVHIDDASRVVTKSPRPPIKRPRALPVFTLNIEESPPSQVEAPQGKKSASLLLKKAVDENMQCRDAADRTHGEPSAALEHTPVAARKRLLLAFDDAALQPSPPGRRGSSSPSESSRLSLLDRSSIAVEHRLGHATRLADGVSSFGGLRAHVEHVQRASPCKTPLSRRDLNAMRHASEEGPLHKTAVCRRQWPEAFEPNGARLLSEIVAARRALARSSIVLAGGDTEFLDM
jgi:hypothetical protein